jgi:molybdate transport system substrate-binding protein
MIRTPFVAVTTRHVATLSCVLLVATSGAALAADIRVISPIALEYVMVPLAPEFERSSGHKVSISYGTAGQVMDRVLKGEYADVVVTTGPQIDNLRNQAKIVPGSRVDLAKVGIGVFVRKGAVKPDISSIEAFKRTLLAAKSVGHVDPALGVPVGIYMTALMERMGIAADVKPKTRLFRVEERFEHVAKGDVEIGFNLIQEILAEPSVDFVGPLPATIQNNTLYAAAIVAISKEQPAGKALIQFISSAAALAVMKAKGFEAP